MRRCCYGSCSCYLLGLAQGYRWGVRDGALYGYGIGYGDGYRDRSYELEPVYQEEPLDILKDRLLQPTYNPLPLPEPQAILDRFWKDYEKQQSELRLKCFCVGLCTCGRR